MPVQLFDAAGDFLELDIYMIQAHPQVLISFNVSFLEPLLLMLGLVHSGLVLEQAVVDSLQFTAHSGLDSGLVPGSFPVGLIESCDFGEATVQGAGS